MTAKPCLVCQEVKAFSEFDRVKNGDKYGLSGKCKACRREYMREYVARERATNPERNRARARACYHRNADTYRAKQREYTRQHPEVFVAKSARRRARISVNGGHFTPRDVTVQLERQAHLCFYCADPLVLEGEGKYNVDHFIPLARGGTNGPNNIVCACPPCNQSKRDRLPWEWMPHRFDSPL